MSEAASQQPASPEGGAPRKGDVRLLIEQVVKMLVDEPNEVFVDENRRGGTLEIDVEVAQKDIGKIIGKQGRTIRALRTLADAAAGKQNLRCSLELIEEDEEDGDYEDESGDGGGDDADDQQP
jgi:predicted RNA-binding protein YlqC (UPF0109 family)